ncbi:TPA: DUF4435 domain-containing protein [Burkholderia vietnamiensis]|nr:DUF4435 domain-containing protein [Burkholderia vietnamiensis]
MIARGLGDVIAEMKMTRAAFDGALIVLEGVTDSHFWRSKIIKDNCQITISGGKSVATKVAKALDEEGFKRFIVIVDDDYDVFFGKEYESDNLVFTETNDLETLLASSPAFLKVLDEHLDHGIVNNRDRVVSDLGANIQAVCLCFGRLRYINRERSYNVCFDDLSPWKYVDDATFELREGDLLTDFAALSGADFAAVEAAYKAVPCERVWNVIQGHDFTCILAIALKRKAQQSCTEKTLCASLRLAYENAWFRATALVRSVAAWEGRQGLAMLA